MGCANVTCAYIWHTHAYELCSTHMLGQLQCGWPHACMCARGLMTTSRWSIRSRQAEGVIVSSVAARIKMTNWMADLVNAPSDGRTLCKKGHRGSTQRIRSRGAHHSNQIPFRVSGRKVHMPDTHVDTRSSANPGGTHVDNFTWTGLALRFDRRGDNCP